MRILSGTATRDSNTSMTQLGILAASD